MTEPPCPCRGEKSSHGAESSTRASPPNTPESHREANRATGHEHCHEAPVTWLHDGHGAWLSVPDAPRPLCSQQQSSLGSYSRTQSGCQATALSPPSCFLLLCHTSAQLDPGTSSALPQTMHQCGC